MAQRIKLGELLVRAGVLDEPRLTSALAEQKRWGGRLGKILVNMGYMSEDLLVKALSKQLGIPRADFASMNLPPDLIEKMDPDFLHEHVVCPVAFDPQRRLLTLAMADPTQSSPLDALRFKTGMRVEPLIAGEGQIGQAIEKLMDHGAPSLSIERASERPERLSERPSERPPERQGPFNGAGPKGPGFPGTLSPPYSAPPPGMASVPPFPSMSGPSSMPSNVGAPPAWLQQHPQPQSHPQSHPQSQPQGWGSPPAPSSSRPNPTGAFTIPPSSFGGANANANATGAFPSPANPHGTQTGAFTLPPTSAPAPGAYTIPRPSQPPLQQHSPQGASNSAPSLDILRTLEGSQIQQQKAIRAMLELLIEKGVFSRDEYLAILNKH